MSESNERLVQLKRRLLATEILAQMPDLVNEHATEFVSSLMKDWYQITDDGQFETTDQTPLRTEDFGPMPVAEISDYLRNEHGYLFKPSRPSGSSTATTVAPPPPPLNRSGMSVAERATYIRKHGEASYLALPADPTAAKPLAEKRRSEMSVEERCRIIRKQGAKFYESIPA